MYRTGLLQHLEAKACAEHVRNFSDDEEGSGIDVPHFVLDPGDLEAVHDEIDGVAVLSGVIALDLQEGDTVAEVRREDLADLLGLRGDDHHGFCLVKTFHDEVHSPDCHKVGDDGIQRKDPAAEGVHDGESQR